MLIQQLYEVGNSAFGKLTNASEKFVTENLHLYLDSSVLATDNLATHLPLPLFPTWHPHPINM